MATRVQPSQIQNLQQIEAAVAGPDGANRLFTVTAQFDAFLSAFSQTASNVQQTGTFTVLVGPVLTRQQFFRAIGTASLAKTNFGLQTAATNMTWLIVGVDADWDDESGQVELRVEVSVSVSGINNSININGLAFQVTILAAIEV